MPALLTRASLLCVLAMSCVLARPGMHSPSPVFAAGQSRGALPGHSPANVHDPITGTVQTITSSSGLTVVQIPQQVVSGKTLSIIIRSTPGARVTVTINYADGTRMPLFHRVGADGYAYLAPKIGYQPQGSQEPATVTVQTILRRTGLNDTVSAPITVLQRIELTGYLNVVPRSIVVGQKVTVTVVANHPNVTVRLTFIYPDGLQEPHGDFYTDATGTFTRRFTVSRTDGTSGVLLVRAVLSYQGISRYAQPNPVRVVLRARK